MTHVHFWKRSISAFALAGVALTSVNFVPSETVIPVASAAILTDINNVSASVTSMPKDGVSITDSQARVKANVSFALPSNAQPGDIINVVLPHGMDVYAAGDIHENGDSSKPVILQNASMKQYSQDGKPGHVTYRVTNYVSGRTNVGVRAVYDLTPVDKLAVPITFSVGKTTVDTGRTATYSAPTEPTRPVASVLGFASQNSQLGVNSFDLTVALSSPSSTQTRDVSWTVDLLPSDGVQTAEFVSQPANAKMTALIRDVKTGAVDFAHSYPVVYTRNSPTQATFTVKNVPAGHYVYAASGGSQIIDPLVKSDHYEYKVSRVSNPGGKSDVPPRVENPDNGFTTVFPNGGGVFLPKTEKGDKGDKGDTGKTGPKGDRGPKGDKGDTGDPGKTGPAGPAGPRGEKGDTGASGPKGDKGDTGETGPRGDRGPKGDKGDTGDKGDQGPRGDKGDQGDRGPKGDKGDTGAKGDKGDTGQTGPKGDRGPKGDKGEKGDKGDQGDRGVTPTIGPDGNWWIGDHNTKVPSTGPRGEQGVSPSIAPSNDGTPTWWIGSRDTYVPATGPAGKDGKDGASPKINPKTNHWEVGGKDTGVPATGDTPYIGDNGNWWIGKVDTNTPAKGRDGQTPFIDKKTGHWFIGSADTGIPAKGQDGVTPTIGENGNWFIGKIDTKVPAKGQDGITPKIGENGHWFIGDKDTGIPAQGADGLTPKIGDNGNWFIGTIDTKIPAQGEKGDKGDKGDNGVTPHIGDNGNWFIGDTDTGVKARAEIVSVGENGNWFIGTVDTGVPSRGENGKPGPVPEISKDGYWVIDGTKTVHRAIPVVPEIGDNGNWFIDGKDTGKPARGEKGDQGDAGLTPYIGVNGNWWIGNKDTGKPARGEKGDPAVDQCLVDAVKDYATPLAVMIPLGIAATVGLSGGGNQAAAEANMNLQKQMGIWNPDIAAAVSAMDTPINRALAGGALALIAGLATLSVINEYCGPDFLKVGPDGKDGSSTGSSDGSSIFDRLFGKKKVKRLVKKTPSGETTITAPSSAASAPKTPGLHAEPTTHGVPAPVTSAPVTSEPTSTSVVSEAPTSAAPIVPRASVRATGTPAPDTIPGIPLENTAH